MPENKHSRETVLLYLKAHCHTFIKKSDLINDTGISNSRLSEILTMLRQEGYLIDTPNRSGQIKFDGHESESISVDNVEDFKPVSDEDVRRWLIIFVLSQYGSLTFNELLLKTMHIKDESYENSDIILDPDTREAAYDNSGLIRNIRNSQNALFYDEELNVSKDIISVTALRKDLSKLCTEKIIARKTGTHTTYHLTTKAPFIVPVSESSLTAFIHNYEINNTSISGLEPLVSVNQRIKEMIQYQTPETEDYSFGRTNKLFSKQINSFNHFISYPYKTNLIKIGSKNDFEQNTATIFGVGLIYYSLEAGSFFLLGYNHSEGRISCVKMEQIRQIEVLEEPNEEFHQKKYYDILDEIFASLYEEELSHVKVYYSDYGNVKKRFKDLSKTRNNSSVYSLPNPPEDCPYSFVYEDDLRGLSEFSQYLRGFGSAVLAMEPESLRTLQIDNYLHTLKEYGIKYE